MKRTKLLWCLCTCLLSIPVIAQQNYQPSDAELEQIRNQQKSYQTKPIKGPPPLIDGLLDDRAWDQVEWGGDFIQLQSYEGQKPTQNTAFKILYNDKNLYVGYRFYDTEPDKIVKRMSRRDGFEGDWVEINIDRRSYTQPE